MKKHTINRSHCEVLEESVKQKNAMLKKRGVERCETFGVGFVLAYVEASGVRGHCCLGNRSRGIGSRVRRLLKT